MKLQLSFIPSCIPIMGNKCRQKIYNSLTPKKTFFCFTASPNYVMQVNQGFGLDQNWQAYKYGFSDSNGGYWLGNENMYKMTNNGYQWNLCADVKDELGIQYYVLYTTYIMDAESAGYTYYLSGMIGA